MKTFTVETVVQSRPVDLLRNSVGQVVDQIPGQVSICVTFKRSDGRTHRMLISEEDLNFFTSCKSRIHPLHETFSKEPSAEEERRGFGKLRLLRAERTDWGGPSYYYLDGVTFEALLNHIEAQDKQISELWKVISRG